MICFRADTWTKICQPGILIKFYSVGIMPSAMRLQQPIFLKVCVFVKVFMVCVKVFIVMEHSSFFSLCVSSWTDSQLPLQLIVHCALLRAQWNLQLEGGAVLRGITSQKPPLLLGNPQPQSLSSSLLKERHYGEDEVLLLLDLHASRHAHSRSVSGTSL